MVDEGDDDGDNGMDRATTCTLVVIEYALTFFCCLKDFLIAGIIGLVTGLGISFFIRLSIEGGSEAGTKGAGLGISANGIIGGGTGTGTIGFDLELCLRTPDFGTPLL